MAEQLIYIIMLASIALSALCSTLEATLLSTPLSFITGIICPIKRMSLYN